MRIYLEAYGCALNRGEAREMVEGALSRGHVLAGSPAGADVILFDTCAVIQATEDRLLDRLRALAGHGRTVVVAGCLAAVRPEQVLKACPWAIPFPPGRRMTFNGLLSSIRAMPGPVGDPPAADTPQRGQGEAWAQAGWRPEVTEDVPIADGCRGGCTYCIARLARGELRSRPLDDILGRVSLLVKRGCREVRLTAPDTGLYGLDIGTDLCALLAGVCALEGDFRVRLGMMNPETLRPVFEAVMNAYEHPRMFKFLHLPAQSGDDAVLERMGRRYTAADLGDLAGRYRSRFPHAIFSTDIIIGFPGENEEGFKRTLALVESARPDIINIKAFSPRPGTPAFRMHGRPAAEEVRARIKRLNEARIRISMETNGRMVGRAEEVLVTENARGGVLTRTAGYYPVLISAQLPLGTFQMVRITRPRAGYLIGEPM